MLKQQLSQDISNFKLLFLDMDKSYILLSYQSMGIFHTFYAIHISTFAKL